MMKDRVGCSENTIAKEPQAVQAVGQDCNRNQNQCVHAQDCTSEQAETSQNRCQNR